MKDNKDIFHILIISCIFLLGIYFRFKAYLYIRPLWLDECALFFNIYELKYLELFQGLNYIQSAPPVFLVISKYVISHFGIKEVCIRFLPFISSLISIPVFYIFSKIFLKKKWSIIIANILFAINLQLIFYSQEFKQYSSDILITMILFILLNKISVRKITTKQIILYIGITTVFPLISLPSYFIIAGWFLREIFRCPKEKYIKLFAIQIPILCMTIAYYLCALSIQRQNILYYTASTWIEGFINTDMHNNINIIVTNFKFFFNPCNSTMAIILKFVLFIVGIVFLLKKIKLRHYAQIIYILLTIISFSILKLFPISHRVILFLIPIIIVIMSKCLDYLSFKSKLYTVVIILAFILSFQNYNIKYIKSCNNLEYWRYIIFSPNLLLKELQNTYNPKDTVFIYAPSYPEYKYYKIYYEFEPAKEKIIPKYHNKYEKLLNKEMQNIDSCWFFFSSDWDFERNGVKSLKEMKNKNNFRKTYEKEINTSYLLYIEK